MTKFLSALAVIVATLSISAWATVANAGECNNPCVPRTVSSIHHEKVKVLIGHEKVVVDRLIYKTVDKTVVTQDVVPPPAACIVCGSHRLEANAVVVGPCPNGGWATLPILYGYIDRIHPKQGRKVGVGTPVHIFADGTFTIVRP